MLTLSLSRWRQAHSLLWQRYADVSLAAWLYVGCAFAALTGLMWDGAWHQSWGRDTFFIPPHDLMYASVTVMFAFITLIVGGLSLNFWAIRQWYRVEGTLYPWLGLMFGPMVLVIAQRVTRRAGAATVSFLIPFCFMGAMGALLSALQYPLVVS